MNSHIQKDIYSYTCTHIYMAPEQNTYLYRYIALDNLTTCHGVLLNIIACVRGGGCCASYCCCLSVILVLYPMLYCVGTPSLAERLLTSVGQLEWLFISFPSLPFNTLNFIPLSWPANFGVHFCVRYRKLKDRTLWRFQEGIISCKWASG